jgi:hypothetical protein
MVMVDKTLPLEMNMLVTIQMESLKAKDNIDGRLRTACSREILRMGRGREKVCGRVVMGTSTLVNTKMTLNAATESFIGDQETFIKDIF